MNILSKREIRNLRTYIEEISNDEKAILRWRTWENSGFINISRERWETFSNFSVSS